MERMRLLWGCFSRGRETLPLCPVSFLGPGTAPANASRRTESRQQYAEEFLMRIGARKQQPDAPRIAQDDRAELEHFEPALQSSVPESPTRRIVSTSTQAAAESRSRNWLGHQAWQLVRSAKSPSCCPLILVFHLAAGAINLLVELLSLARKAGDNKARVGPLRAVLGPGDDAALSVPTAGRVVEKSRRSAAFLWCFGTAPRRSSSSRRRARAGVSFSPAPRCNRCDSARTSAAFSSGKN